MKHLLQRLTRAEGSQAKIGKPSLSDERTAGSSGSQGGRILFVCTANICRSPMAEVVFNALAQDKGLPFRARSAGTAALQGSPMAANALAVLEEVGFRPGPHRARQVDSGLLEESDLVLVMNPRHAEVLGELSANPTTAIYTLPEYASRKVDTEGIPDPYGHSMITFRSSLRQIHDYVELTVDRLASGRKTFPHRDDV